VLLSQSQASPPSPPLSTPGPLVPSAVSAPDKDCPQPKNPTQSRKGAHFHFFSPNHVHFPNGSFSLNGKPNHSPSPVSLPLTLSSVFPRRRGGPIRHADPGLSQISAGPATSSASQTPREGSFQYHRQLRSRVVAVETPALLVQDTLGVEIEGAGTLRCGRSKSTLIVSPSPTQEADEVEEYVRGRDERASFHLPS